VFEASLPLPEQVRWSNSVLMRDVMDAGDSAYRGRGASAGRTSLNLATSAAPAAGGDRIAAAAEGRDRPLVVGLCGPQGSGKSTLGRRWSLACCAARGLADGQCCRSTTST
jgi:hypothetical protein